MLEIGYFCVKILRLSMLKTAKILQFWARLLFFTPKLNLLVLGLKGFVFSFKGNTLFSFFSTKEEILKSRISYTHESDL